MRRVLIVAALLCAAPVVHGAERVVVLEPSSTSDLAWPSGQRAVVAELVASGVELVIRPSSAENANALELEVIGAARELGARGAVGVGRLGSLGFAFVVLHDAQGSIRIEDDAKQGPVADGAVALRVSEVLKVRHFNLPPEPPKPEPKAPVAPPRERPPAAEHRPSLWPWLAFAGMASRGASSMAPALALGLRVPFNAWLSLEPSGAFSLGPLRVDTPAGDVDLSVRRALLEVVIAPTDHQGLSAGVGAGAGVAWLAGSAVATAGYAAVDRSTQVSVISLRGFGVWQAEQFRLLGFAEISALLPAATVYASGNEVGRLGQPSMMAGVAVGYGP
jgi:hypothetical protein